MIKLKKCKSLLILIILSLILSIGIVTGPMIENLQANSDNWVWQNPLPQGNNLGGVWGRAPDDVFVVGGGGTILHYDGSSWSLMSSGTSNNLNGVWGSGLNDVFAVGENGTILHYNGTNWNPMDSGFIYGFYGVWGSGPNDVFAVGSQCNIFHYNGSSWTNVYSHSHGNWSHLRSVWGSSSTDVFAVGDNGTILHYNGSSWSLMSSGTSKHLHGVWGSGPNDVFAVGFNGTILRYNGSSWNPISSSGDFYSVWGSGSDDVFVVGGGGTIRHYDGSSWYPMISGTQNNIYGVWGSGPEDVFAVGVGCNILHYDGINWSFLYKISWRITTYDLNSIWGNSPNDVFAVASSGSKDKILHYDDGNWSNTGGPDKNLYGVWGCSSIDVFAVGASGTIVRYNGSGWIPMSSGTTQNLNGVWGSGPNDIFAVGNAGTIIRYNGSSWSSMSSGTSNKLNGVWGSSSIDVFAVGASGTIVRYNGTNWSSMSSGTTQNLNGVWGSGPNDVFAVGDAGTIIRYNGSSWSSMSSGTTYNLRGVWGSGPNDVFAVGFNGTILHYNGTNWNPMISGAQFHLNGVWGSGPEDVFAVGEKGTILHYGTLPSHTVTFDTSPNDTGKISFDRVIYSDGDTISKILGGKYNIVANIATGYTFTRWEVEGEINITDPNSPNTICTVLGDGVLRLVQTSATPKTWYVDGALGTDDTSHGTGPGVDAFKTIQYAIDHTTTSGDTIIVAAGTYNESVVVNKSLTLLGAKKDVDPRGETWTGNMTIIKAGEKKNGILITASNVILNGFKIQESGTAGEVMVEPKGDESGIYVFNNTTPLLNIVIKYCWCDQNYGSGITLRDIEDPTVEYCYISNSGFSSSISNVAGIGGQELLGGSISNNEIFNNYAYGVFLGGGSADCGRYNAKPVDGILISNNNIHSNSKYGIQLIALYGSVKEVIIRENNIYNNARNGLKIVNSGNCEILNNRVTNNGQGVTNPIYGYGLMIRAEAGYPTNPATCNKIEGNTFTKHSSGSIYVESTTAGNAENNTVHFNNFLEGSGKWAINNTSTFNVDATKNWWGDESGPSGVGPGTGDAVSTNVNYSPWLVPNISVTKSDSLDPISQGVPLTYTINWSMGSTWATWDETTIGTTTVNIPSGLIFNDVSLKDTLPSEVTYVSCTGGGTHSSGVITWNLGTYTPGKTGSITVNVNVNLDTPNGTITNNVEIIYDLLKSLDIETTTVQKGAQSVYYFYDSRSNASFIIDLFTLRWRVTIPSKGYDTGWMSFNRYTKTNNHFWGEYADTRYHFIIDFYSSGRYHIIFDDRVTRISIKIAN